MLRLRGILMAGVGLSLSLAAWSAPNWKTLTDAPRNIDGTGFRKDRPVDVPYSNNQVIVAMPNDTWVVNSDGAMGADREYYQEVLGARMGIWAGQSLEGKQPRAVVSEWVGNIKQITGGEWAAPKATHIAGVPVVQASGTDAFGNYFYRVIGFNKLGVNYAVAVRIPYEHRFSRPLDEDITSVITDCHWSTQAVAKKLKKTQRR
jgi:hypothetical protein